MSSVNIHQDTIQRCPHDRENPYTMVRNSLIRDKSISPSCRWMIIFLLSNAAGWVIKVAQIAKEVKEFMGRDSVYDLMNEAINAGYIKREEYTVNNMKRYRYLLSEEPKFKKSFLYPELQETEPQGTENQDSKERTSEEKISKEKPSLKSSSSEERQSDPPDPLKIDDDDKGVASFLDEVGEITVTNTRGQPHSIAQSEIYRHFSKYSQYPTSIIREAIKRTKEIKTPINNIIKYMESVCESIFSSTKPSQEKKQTINKEKPVDHSPRVNMGDVMKQRMKDKKGGNNVNRP